MTYFIKNWDRFQHFKDRNPPWVKLYKDLLDDPDWHELDAECCKALVMLWLIASEDEYKQGQLPCSKKLSFRLRISENKLNQTLTKLSNWVIQDDINVISLGYQSDAPETETETETDIYVEQKLNGKDCLEVLDYLNEKTKRGYRPVKVNLNLIAARFNEGATIELCKRVIDCKVAEWINNPKMRSYLRPATLFGAEKFAQYSGEVNVVQSLPWAGAI